MEMKKIKKLGTEHLEGSEYELPSEDAPMFGMLGEDAQEAIDKNTKLAETGFKVQVDNPMGLASNEDSIKHIAAQERNLVNSIAAPGSEDYKGPTTKVKLPEGWDSFGEMPIGDKLPDMFQAKFQPKDEAQIWKERYYLLLSVVNSFHKD